METARRSEAADSDDGTLGRIAPGAGGFQVPDLSDADREYLEGATSDRDFMARMTSIAHRMDNARKEEGQRVGRQTPDDYLNSLGPTASSKPAEVIEAAEVNAGDVRAVDESDKYVEEVTRGRKEVLKDPVTPGEELAELGEDTDEDDDSEEIKRKIAQLQAEIRERAGVTEADLLPEDDAPAPELELEPESESEPEPEPESEPAVSEVVDAAGGKPAVVDRQIDFLENYLAKLKREEAEEAAPKDADAGGAAPKEAAPFKPKRPSAAAPSLDGPRFEGLEDAPGEMSAAEKMAAFEAIRRQAQMRAGGLPDFADPLAASLPKRENAPQEDEGPMPEQDAEDENFLAVLKLEMEVKKYLVDARAMLDEHERRMQELIELIREGM